MVFALVSPLVGLVVYQLMFRTRCKPELSPSFISLSSYCAHPCQWILSCGMNAVARGGSDSRNLVTITMACTPSADNCIQTATLPNRTKQPLKGQRWSIKYSEYYSSMRKPAHLS